ncbi:hypothetical protein [Marinomonas sp.]
MEVLVWLEMSSIGLWVSTSVWGYPIVLTLHTLGMGTLVGLSLMIALRVLGMGNGIPLERINLFWKWALIGFVVNLVSGSTLFIGNASSFWYSWPLRIKLLLICAGLLMTHRLVNSVAKDSQRIMKHKAQAIVAMVCWLGALIAGRLIAYIF